MAEINRSEERGGRITVRHALGSFGLDASPLLPAVALLAFVALAAEGYTFVGFGVLIGALLAFANTDLLIKRIDLAALTSDPAAALVSMQVGLIVTFVVIGVLTFAMLHVSVQMTVAMAISFLVSQTCQLMLVYQGRKAGAVASRRRRLLFGKGSMS